MPSSGVRAPVLSVRLDSNLVSSARKGIHPSGVSAAEGVDLVGTASRLGYNLSNFRRDLVNSVSACRASQLVRQ